MSIKFEGVTIIVPVIRESAEFERVVERLLETCNHEDIAEFIIAIHPELTGEDSLRSIEKMRGACEAAGIPYSVLPQKLPGMGGAIRDAMSVAKGSHSTVAVSDYCYDPIKISELIEISKQFPNDVAMASRHLIKTKRSKDYPLVKYVFNVIAQQCLKILYLADISDFTAMIWVYPTIYFNCIQWDEVKHPFALEQMLKYIRLGVKFHQIPFVFIGGSESGFFETFSYLRPALKCRFLPKKMMIKTTQDDNPFIKREERL